MGMEHWWNETDKGKLKYWQKNLPQWHFVHHKLHMDRPWDRTRAYVATGLT